jgi:hypothetical protein
LSNLLIKAQEKAIQQCANLKKYIPLLSPAIKKNWNGKNVCEIDEKLAKSRIDLIAIASTLSPVALGALAMLVAAIIAAVPVLTAIVTVIPPALIALAIPIALALSWLGTFILISKWDANLTYKAIDQQAVAQYQKESLPDRSALEWIAKRKQALKLLFKQEEVDFTKTDNYPSKNKSTLLNHAFATDTVNTLALLWDNYSEEDQKQAFKQFVRSYLPHTPRCFTYLFEQNKISPDLFSEAEQNCLLLYANGQFFKLLLQQGFNKNARSEDGNTLLDKVMERLETKAYKESYRHKDLSFYEKLDLEFRTKYLTAINAERTVKE